MDSEFLRYRFEDGCDGVITRNKFKIGVRHVQIIYMFLCSMVLGAMRGSIPIGVLSVVDNTRENETYILIHDWNRRTQGAILSSFLFGYTVMLIPAEVYLRKLGDKFILTSVLLINGGMSAAMPTIVNKGGWIAVYNAHLLMGMTQACLSPINQALLAKWLPPAERNIGSLLVHWGVILGMVIAMPISGVISQARLGWELVYYSQAMMTMSMAAIWAILTASSPDQHQAVGDTEKEYIKDAMASYHKKEISKPWQRILKSSSFWAITCAHASSNAIFVFFLMDVPALLTSTGLSIKDSAWQSTLPFVFLWLVYIMTAPLIDWVYKIAFLNRLFDLKLYRKIINGIGALASVIGLTVVPNLAPNWNHLGISVLTGTLGLQGLQYSGFLENAKDITQNFSGTVVIMSSFLASIVGSMVPLATGLIIGDDMMDLSRWRYCFLLLGGFSIVCNSIYTVFGGSERASWDGTARNKFGYSNDITQLELEEFKHMKITYENHDDTLI